MSEKCPKTGIASCPHLDEYEVDDIQGCKPSCYHPDWEESALYLMPESCPLDICAEIKAAREEVLDLAKEAYDDFPYQRKHPGNLNFLEYLDWLYKERFGEG